VHAWVRSNDCRNVGLCVNTGLHISHTASRTAERKMSRPAKDDDSLLVYDCAASQLTSAAIHITHTLAVIQNAIKRPIVGWITDVQITGTSRIIYSRLDPHRFPYRGNKEKQSELEAKSLAPFNAAVKLTSIHLWAEPLQSIKDRDSNLDRARNFSFRHHIMTTSGGKHTFL